MNRKKVKKQPDKVERVDKVDKVESIEKVERVNGDESESRETPDLKHNARETDTPGPDSPDGPWYLGVCKWFNGTKGWGFVNLIEPSSDNTTTTSSSSSSSNPGPSGDVFVHQGSILMSGFRCLAVGDQVEFQAARRAGKGWEAVAVRGVGGKELRAPASWRRPGVRGRKVRCFNCGNLARHLAADCPKPPLPKRCHHCKVKLRRSCPLNLLIQLSLPVHSPPDRRVSCLGAQQETQQTNGKAGQRGQ